MASAEGTPATSPSGSIVDECRHLGPVVPDVPGPHPAEMAGTAHGIDHRLVQCVEVAATTTTTSTIHPRVTSRLTENLLTR